MGTFQFYFEHGWHHIVSFAGSDHVLFVLALCATYLIKDWKRVAALVTAFTIGHSFTLVMMANEWLTFNMSIVELYLIPGSILITGLINVMGGQATQKSRRFLYSMALVFGLVHGMAFGTDLGFMLSGMDVDTVTALFAFNVGLEVGQLLFVGIVLLTSFVLVNVLQVKQREWNLFLSGGVALRAFILLLENIWG